jgi:hypothetical protein
MFCHTGQEIYSVFEILVRVACRMPKEIEFKNFIHGAIFLFPKVMTQANAIGKSIKQ